jgi:predicted nucleic acid-binding protein
VTTFILDNSVTMRWCFDAGLHPYADSVLHQLEAIDGMAFVPVLWRYEVSAVLARAQTRGEISGTDAADFLTDLRGLNIVIDTAGTEHILTTAHQLAVTHRLTSYDAAYLDLALRRNLPLATLDKDLARACQTAGGTIL